jgi:hypothetical protein
MFHWICPECGREIAPTVRECPACDPNAVVAEPALAGVVEAPPARPIVNDATPPASSSVRPIVNAAAPSESKSVRPVELSNTAPVTPPPESSALGEPILPQFDASLRSHPLQYLSDLLDEPENPDGPPRAERRFPIATPKPSVPHALRALIAELKPAAERPLLPVTGSSPAQPQAEPPLVRSTVALPQGRARKIVTVPRRSADGPPVALAAPAPKPAEPATPNLGPAPALAGLAKYSPLEGRPLRPAVPPRDVLHRDSVPRTTLAGPVLPARLMKFQDRELNPILSERYRPRKRGIPAWAVTILILGTVLVAGFNTVFSIVPRSGGEAQASTSGTTSVTTSETISATVSDKVQAAEAALPATSSSPLSRAIEVTGFRIQADSAKKSEIQYLVVNHTPNRFAGVTVYVTLHAASEAPGQPPLGRFEFAAPDLGAYESKEMSSAIERVNHPAHLPDWQDVRADVEIGQ